MLNKKLLNELIPRQAGADTAAACWNVGIYRHTGRAIRDVAKLLNKYSI